jgi:hypothetical protein
MSILLKGLFLEELEDELPVGRRDELLWKPSERVPSVTMREQSHETRTKSQRALRDQSEISPRSVRDQSEASQRALRGQSARLA